MVQWTEYIVISLLLLLATVGAASRPLSTLSSSSSRALSLSLSLSTSSNTAADAISEYEIVKIFGRVADNYLLLDVEGAGTPEMANCCHGGCDNCNYSRIFDCMSARSVKWIPLYKDRKLIDGREHTSTWSSVFFPSNTTSTATLTDAVDSMLLCKKDFCHKIASLPFNPPLGPMISIASDDTGSTTAAAMIDDDTAISRLFDKIVSAKTPQSDASDEQSMMISCADFITSLIQLTSEPHGISYGSFKKLFI